MNPNKDNYEDAVDEIGRRLVAYANELGVPMETSGAGFIVSSMIREMFEIDPEYDLDTDDDDTHGLVTIVKHWSDGGSTIKLANVLNLKKGIEVLVVSVTSTLSGLGFPHLSFVFVLSTFYQLMQIAKVEINEREAAVLVIIWIGGGNLNKNGEDELLNRLNSEFRENNRMEMNQIELLRILEKLELIGCVSKLESGSWLSTERINIKM